MSLKFHILPRKNPQTGLVKYYPSQTRRDNISFDQVATDIEKETSLSAADVRSALMALQSVITRRLLEGHSVSLGDLGTFSTTIVGKGQPTEKDVTADVITKVNVGFRPTTKFRAGLQRPFATFELPRPDEKKKPAGGGKANP